MLHILERSRPGTFYRQIELVLGLALGPLSRCIDEGCLLGFGVQLLGYGVGIYSGFEGLDEGEY